MLQKNLYKQDNYFVVTGAVNEKNGANGSMLDLIFSLEKIANVVIITIGRPPFIGLFESILREKRFSCSISFLPFYRYFFKKPNVIFLIANTKLEQIIYLKKKYPNTKLMIFQTGDVKNNKETLIRYTLVDNILFESSGQMADFVNLYQKYKGKSLLLNPTIKEEKFFKFKNELLNSDYLKNNIIIKFIIVGSVQERKNQLQAIQVCQILKEKYHINLKLLVVGPFVHKEYEEKIKGFVKSNNLEDLVEFTGFKKEYSKLLSSSHIVLSFSKEEGLSTIIRESLYLKKLIIATNISGNIGTLDENNSIVINLNDTNQLIAEHISSVLTDEEKVQNMMHNAKVKYLENHTSKYYLENLQKIIRYEKI